MAGLGVHVVTSAAALVAPPDQPVVILVHGAMDRSASFARSVRLLPDLPLIRYDRRGYGHSTELGIGDLDAHANDLSTLIAGRPAVLVGHSIGGVIALMAAQDEPGVVSVAAWEAPMPWAPWWPAFSAGGAALAAMPPGGSGGDRSDRRDGAEADAANASCAG